MDTFLVPKVKVRVDFIQEDHLDWSRCCGICTDGARAMTGRYSGLVKQVQAVAPVDVWSHCIIHRQALATKRMPKELRAVLDEAVKIINLIKSPRHECPSLLYSLQ